MTTNPMTFLRRRTVCPAAALFVGLALLTNGCASFTPPPGDPGAWTARMTADPKDGCGGWWGPSFTPNRHSVIPCTSIAGHASANSVRSAQQEISSRCSTMTNRAANSWFPFTMIICHARTPARMPVLPANAVSHGHQPAFTDCGSHRASLQASCPPTPPLRWF